MTSDQTSYEGIILSDEQIEKFKKCHKAVAEWGHALFRGWHPGAEDVMTAGKIMGDILGDLALEIGVVGYDDKHRVVLVTKDIDEWRRIHEDQEKNKEEITEEDDGEEGEDDEFSSFRLQDM